MRLLYLHYGPQSGVTDAITGRLAGAGVEVIQHNPVRAFLYQLRTGSRIPNARPAVVRAVLEAMRLHKVHWKAYYLHTPFAFDHLSRQAARAIVRTAPDRVVQAGALFGPGPYPSGPYHLYLDHTRAIAERYPSLPGLPPAVAYHREWRAREQTVYRNALSIFTMSEFVRNSLRDDYGVDPARVHVVGAGPNVVPDQPAAPPREPLLLFVGKQFAPKGGPELLDAFTLVRRAHPRARLAVVSASVPRPLPPGVEFHGLLSREALARLYSAAAVFVLPTLREAFGLSLLEAMSFGLPVVASRIEAIPEIVSDGETGLLVPPREAGALADALIALLADPVRARQMGAAGRHRAQARFGWERAASRMLAVLRPEPAALETGLFTA
ncbi:MAG TPA: glycosyltransferase family 4 protein [Anaeromyxobacter sp.]|nr:glycosyltransferase family 4 protein [Anaeromyxobacter sp.]